MYENHQRAKDFFLLPFILQSTKPVPRIWQRETKECRRRTQKVSLPDLQNHNRIEIWRDRRGIAWQ